MKCQMPHFSNDLPPSRTSECRECNSKILEAPRSFSRPLSELINLEKATSNLHQNSNQESDRPVTS
jgi:DNA-directed RNA polymerase subunit RPC12/RpoP